MYNVEIATGQQDGEDSFKAHIVKTLSCTDKKIMAEVPYWGCQYTWRVMFNNGRGDEIKSPVYHFSTNYIMGIDSNQVRLRVLQASEHYKDAFIFLDNNRALYDMQGHAVWFLPEKEGLPGIPRDMKLTKKGTITFLIEDKAYEIDFDGKVLWKGPDNGKVSGDISERYHHELTKLSNGHYMVLGDERMVWKPKHFLKDKNVSKVMDSTINTHFMTIIEYDERSNVVWSWKSSSYFTGSDIEYYKPANPRPDGDMDVHGNAFYFDEKNNVIYLGFRNINRIVKLNYPEGKILNVYGPVYVPGAAAQKNRLFCGQHSICKTEKGDLCVFNNNSCDSGGEAEVVVMKEPIKKNERLKKIWEYSCPVERNVGALSQSGGNVTELPDRSLFVYMGMDAGKVFIVNMEKKINWMALPEKWDNSKKKWYAIPGYRASIIYDHKELEKLIWNTGNTR